MKFLLSTCSNYKNAIQKYISSNCSSLYCSIASTPIVLLLENILTCLWLMLFVGTIVENRYTIVINTLEYY